MERDGTYINNRKVLVCNVINLWINMTNDKLLKPKITCTHLLPVFHI